MNGKLRFDAKYDIELALINAIEKTDDPFANCLNCLNFDEKNEICNLYNQRPPAKVIAYGCPQWIDVTEIPY